RGVVEIHVDAPRLHRRLRRHVRARLRADRCAAEGTVVEEELNVGDLLIAGDPAVDLGAAADELRNEIELDAAGHLSACAPRFDAALLADRVDVRANRDRVVLHFVGTNRTRDFVELRSESGELWNVEIEN